MDDGLMAIYTKICTYQTGAYLGFRDRGGM